MSIYNHIWSHLPHAASDANEFVVSQLPSVTIRRSYLSCNMLSAPAPDHPSVVFVCRLADLCRRSGSTLQNTVDGLKKLFLDAWARSSGLPVFAIGPLFAAASKPPANRGMKDGGVADAAAGCQAWLDWHPLGLVVCVSFGLRIGYRPGRWRCWRRC